jgi:hypothetical protein
VSSGSCTFVVGEGDGEAGQPDRGWPARRCPQVLHVGDLRGVSLEAIEVGLGDSAFPEGISERDERRDGVIAWSLGLTQKDCGTDWVYEQVDDLVEKGRNTV